MRGKCLVYGIASGKRRLFHQKAAGAENKTAPPVHRHGYVYWQNEQPDQRCPDELIAAPFLRQLSEADEISANERFKESTVA